MAGRELTAFEHILLGRICSDPSSGYDLKRVFARTPMGVYQPSSGALYPALRRLERMNLIKAQADASETSRPRRVYGPTAEGSAAHAAWLRQPVEPATVARDLGLHLMRFAMMEHQVPRSEVLAYLTSFRDALAAFTANLERFSAAASLHGALHPRLALEHGVAVHQASLRWAEDTIATLSAAAPPVAS